MCVYFGLNQEPSPFIGVYNRDINGDCPRLIPFNPNEDTGDLKANGVVIVCGVPYTLEQSHSSDEYFTYQ